MRCNNCHNDLLVRIEPKGLGNLLRLVPLAPYRCVKCGARNWRASDDWGRTGTRAALMAAVLAAMVWAIWYANRPAPGPSSVVREQVDATARPPRDAMANASAATAPAPGMAPTESPAMPREVPLDRLPDDDGAARAATTVAQADQADQPDQPDQPAPQSGPVTTESLRRSAREAETPGLDEVQVAPAPSGTVAPEVTPEVTPGVTPETAPDQAAPSAESTAPKQADEPGWLNPPASRLVGEPAPADAGPGTIADIDFLPETDRLLVSVAAGRAVENAETHLWPPKFVVDIPGRWNWDGPKAIKVGRRGVVRIRAAAHEDKFRIVLDMDPAPETPPTIQPSPGGLLILVE